MTGMRITLANAKFSTLCPFRPPVNERGLSRAWNFGPDGGRGSDTVPGVLKDFSGNHGVASIVGAPTYTNYGIIVDNVNNIVTDFVETASFTIYTTFRANQALNNQGFWAVSSWDQGNQLGARISYADSNVSGAGSVVHQGGVWTHNDTTPGYNAQALAQTSAPTYSERANFRRAALVVDAVLNQARLYLPHLQSAPTIFNGSAAASLATRQLTKIDGTPLNFRCGYSGGGAATATSCELVDLYGYNVAHTDAEILEQLALDFETYQYLQFPIAA